jgi:lipopolysaccharide/colanic/teichoic acid biosynthesis glycosyltransferase
VTSVRDDAGVASHSKNVLSSSTGVNRTAQVSENDEASDGEAAVNHDHQYQATFQEDNKAAAPQP